MIKRRFFSQDNLSKSKYLTIEPLADGFTFSFSSAIQYNIDNTGWKSLEPKETSPTINLGSHVSLKKTLSFSNSSIGQFTMTGRCCLTGNCMSLLYGDDVSEERSMTGFISAFENLFKGCMSIESVSENLLPAKLLEVYCYKRMFYECYNLKNAPNLPAVELKRSCYESMFRYTGINTPPIMAATVLDISCCESMFSGCDRLKEAPILHATTMAYDCYMYMFDGCAELTSPPSLPAETLADSCYYGMFKGCCKLTTAPVLPATIMKSLCYMDMFRECTMLVEPPKLPATTLAFQCYMGMFRECTMLVEPPKLPATTLAFQCYMGMFAYCGLLHEAPELPATKMATMCYRDMFAYCESLTKSPVLPALYLEQECYAYMFRGCSQLSYIKALFLSVTAGYDETYEWVENVAPAGTFIKNKDATWSIIGANGVPEGWTVITE